MVLEQFQLMSHDEYCYSLRLKSSELLLMGKSPATAEAERVMTQTNKISDQLMWLAFVARDIEVIEQEVKEIMVTHIVKQEAERLLDVVKEIAKDESIFAEDLPGDPGDSMPG